MTIEAVSTGNGTLPAGDLGLLQAEVASEGKPRPDLPEGAVRVPLYARDGVLVHEFAVLHPDDWPSSANEDVNSQRYFTWARKVMATDEDRLLWEATDPRNREVVGFINAWQAASGNDPKAGRG